MKSLASLLAMLLLGSSIAFASVLGVKHDTMVDNDTFTSQITRSELKLTPDQCKMPPRRQCDWYKDCLEDTFKCGSKGYPIAYGEHYCNAFKEGEHKFSDQGKQWVWDTMQCLQRDLVVDATGEMGGINPKTAHACDALSDKAFGTHAECYVLSGVCQLSWSDWGALKSIVGAKPLFTDWKAFKQSVATAAACLGFNNYVKDSHEHVV